MLLGLVSDKLWLNTLCVSSIKPQKVVASEERENVAYNAVRRTHMFWVLSAKVNLLRSQF